MGCESVKLGDLGFATVCSRGRRKAPKCAYCSQPSTKLCDGKREKGTCDRPMCPAHVSITSGSTDFCRDCSPNKAVQQRLPEAQW